MQKLEKRFVDLGESAVAVGVFQGGLLLSLLVGLFAVAMALIGNSSH